MSATLAEVTQKYSNVSPQLANAAHENLHCFAKLNKVLIDFTEKIASIHCEAANSLTATVGIFEKKLHELTKIKQCQNDSYVKFIKRIFEQTSNQAQILLSLGNSFSDCVITPLQDVLEKKKEVWKSCFHYVQSFQEQIRKKEEDLVKRRKDYSDAALKLKLTNDQKPKLQLFCDNSHNTYLLRLSSVNSLNSLLYTHVLPHVLHLLEKNQSELNDLLRHHITYMFSVQKETLKKLSKSVDRLDHATHKINIVSDFQKFVKSTIKTGLKDWNPPAQKFFNIIKSDQIRGSVSVDLLDDTFIVNQYTQPNLHRRLASLQYQTNQLVNSISTMKACDNQEVNANGNDEKSMNEIIQLLCICDKEANLNVVLKQMELYTSPVLSSLGPASQDLLSECQNTKVFPTDQSSDAGSLNGQKPHEFIESRLIKPLTCNYCGKIISIIGKGFTCKNCKMSVHKKCATNVLFCDGVLIRKPKQKSRFFDSTSMVSETIEPESSVVYDLIDFEDEDCDDCFDNDQFNDGLSDEEDNNSTLQGHAIGMLTPILTPLDLNKPDILTESQLGSEDVSSFSNFKIFSQKASNQTQGMPILSKFCQLPEKTMLPVIKPSIAKKPLIPLKPVTFETENFCVALYDYSKTQSRELNLFAGSKIKILEKSNNDWWKGKMDGSEGFFPSQYVMEINETDTILCALYDFQSENTKELSIDKGQILVLLEIEDDWYKVKSTNGEGLVPASYVKSF